MFAASNCSTQWSYRIRLARFLAVLTPVSACWAALQTVVGVAVWQALLGG